jgi:SAM-dependent methyltransferase
MKEPVIRKLLSINLEFYQTFASNFAATRSRLQPGVKRIIDHLPARMNILEVGCGNGELARRLADQDHEGVYIGLDFSSELLDIARTRLTEFDEESKGKDDNCIYPRQETFTFLHFDITSDTWDTEVHNRLQSISGRRRFDRVFVFSTLHHLPGKKNQLKTLSKFYSLLEDGGCLVHSNWQFLNSERLRKRILPWSEVGLNQEDVDDGDYLLDWRRGGYGMRYVHHFKEEELCELAKKTGFRIVDSFLSDGEGGKLGLYQVWEKVSNWFKD